MNLRTIGLLAVVATVTLATGVRAQAEVEMYQYTNRFELVAEELFGGDAVKLEFEDVDAIEQAPVWAAEMFAPLAGLIVQGTISSGTEFEVTYTLSNATFAEPVSMADIVLGVVQPDADGIDNISGNADDGREWILTRADPSPVTLERRGGEKDSESVTFIVSVNTAMTKIRRVQPSQGPFTGQDYYFFFLLPDLNVTTDLRAPDPGPERISLRVPTGRYVGLNTTVYQRRSGGSAISDTVRGSSNCDESLGCPMVAAVKAIKDIANTPGEGLISREPADKRSVLVGADGEASKPQRALLTTVRVTPSDDFATYRDRVYDRDGDLVDGFAGDLAGRMVIEVSSDSFNSGDMVYIDADANGEVDVNEAFDMGDAVASTKLPLGYEPMTLYYVPSGDAALKHRAEFTTTARTEFRSRDNKVRAAAPAMAHLLLHGIKETVAKAYGIAPLSSSDATNVRVTCEASIKAGCHVFLDCKDPAGEEMFHEAGVIIGPNATEHWDQMKIADTLGLDEGWEGWLACDVLSTAPISVQVLTRSEGVLTNTTYVTEGGR